MAVPGEDFTRDPSAPRQTEDGICVVTVGSDLDYLHTPAVREELRAAVAAGAQAVVFDLRASTFMDSSGLTLLVDALRQLGNGRVALARLDPHALRVLETTGVETRLRICETVDQALAALRTSES